MGAQRQVLPVLDEEGVLHVARRVVRREIERTEVVVVVLHLRPLAHGIADAGEDVDDALAHQGDGVQAAYWFREGRARRVGGCLFLRPGMVLHGSGQFLEAVLRQLLQAVHALAEGAFLLGRHLFEVLEQRGDGAVAPQCGHAEAFHVLGIARRGGAHFGFQGLYPRLQVHFSSRIQRRTSVRGRSLLSTGRTVMRSSTSSPSTTWASTVYAPSILGEPPSVA